MRSDGRVVWVLSSVSLVRDAEDEPGHFVALYQDITDRKQAEAGLREAETRYRSLVETIPAVTYLDELDEISTATYISPQVFSMLGFTAQERLADPGLWVKHLHPEDRERVLAGNGRWKVHTLPGYAYGVPDGEGIADPYGQSMSAYRASVRRIFECMDLLVPRLQVSGSR